MNTLWYKTPAEDSSAALPVGNGRLGALVYGNTGHEIIELFEESLWSGPALKRNNPHAKKELKEIRSLLKKGFKEEAQELLLESFTGTPKNQTSYRNAGALHVDFYTSETFGLENSSTVRKNPFEKCTSYRRELDLSTAVATTSFSKDMNVKNTADFSENAFGSSITFTREAFVSAQCNVIAFHISASTPKSIYFRAGFERSEMSGVRESSDDTIIMSDVHGIPFAVMATATASGGKVFTRGGYIIVEAADEATIYIDVESVYRKKSYARKCGDTGTGLRSLASWAEERALKTICFAMGTSYQNLKSGHIAEYTPLYNAVKLSLTGEEINLSVPEIISSGEHTDALWELYWNYSRYLYISSSRKPGNLPALNNGLWSKNGTRFSLFNGATHAVLPGTEHALPLTDQNIFTSMKKLFKNGKITSRTMFGIDAALAFSETDIWADTAPNGTDFTKSYWPLGLAKLSLLAREYYEYTLDKKFLKKNFALMKSAVEFLEEFLIPSADGKTLCVSPSVSQNGLTDSCEDDIKLAALTFKAFLDSANDLDKEPSSSDLMKCRMMLEKIGDLENKEESGLVNFTEMPNNLLNNNFSTLSRITKSIVKSRMHDGMIEIEFLDGATSLWKHGELTGIPLKGNLYADVAWNEGRIKSAKVYAKQGTEFTDELDVVYQTRHYSARITEGSLDILNVLPSTV